MFLKSLYISGFKSFANPTTINFSDNVSAIVGPNGSGKSNISDAIRFVLGEQRTKQMRSHSMEDIIFSGTDSQGPRGLAEVKLVLEDDDNPDLVIERKYYRTGESDYLLNGKKVRLKDIHSLFADTGLGKNGYSIISQGGVENIIGATPKELRELVEEAVGIAGYKVRQNETVRRLNSIESNIERVLDVLEEMEKQLKPLKRQAKKAREYLEISNVLRDIDLVLFYEKEVEFKEELKALDKALVESNFTLMDLDKETAQNDKAYLNYKNQLTEVRERIEALSNEVSKTRENINNYEKEISIKDNDLKNLSENTIRIETELKNLSNSIDETEAKITELNKEREETAKALQKILIDQDELNSKTESIEVQRNNLESVRNEKKLSDLDETVESLKVKQIRLETEIESLKTSEEESLSRKTEIDGKISNLNSEKNKLQSDLNSVKEKNSKFMDQYEKATQKVNKFEKAEQKLNTELVNIENKKEYQIQIRDSYQGFNYPVRSVMTYSTKNKLNGVFGPVGDLFTTKSEFQTAIQVALGGSIQNIVVENSKIAQKLIEFLKNENKGRATFLPLDNISTNAFIFNENPEGFLGTALELIDFDSKFEKVFERLLGRTLVFSDYSSARKFRRSNKRNTLVTLEGECFYPSGAIVGGSFKKNFNQLLSPNQEINNLEKQEKKLSEQLNSVKEQKNSWIKLVEGSTVKRDNRLKEENDLQKKVDSVEQKILILKSELNGIKGTNELEIKEANLKEVESKLQEFESQRNEAGIELNTNKVKIDELNNELINLNTRSTELKIDKNSVENKLTGLNDRLKELNQSLEEDKADLNKRQAEMLEITNSVENNKLRIEELKNDIISLKQTLSQKELNLTEAKSKQKDLETDQADLEERIKVLNHTRIQEVEAKSKVEGKIERINLQEKNLETKIFDQYNENFNSVKDNIDQLRANRQDLDESEIYEFKQRLKKLGNVNPNAVEDYHELKERYTVLKENYDDLISAKVDVENTVDSLNQSMSDQFNEKFELLNQYFNKSFQTLFEGGKAKLNLTSKDNVLESGVELYAQPPGKKTKHINLLSGGEKAMTSIALLFAFLELNPAPFIIIDEIDAALDEANINRFTHYLKKIQEQNQFIIITHRKSTLSECNNIHGVSMAADGISRLVSIKLSDYIGE